MARPITLFTGQWADIPLADLAPLARKRGYDGLELACCVVALNDVGDAGPQSVEWGMAGSGR